MKIAVIGVGAFGRNHVRVLKELGHQVITVDKNGFADHKNLDPSVVSIDGISYINAAIVATPASTHYEICKYLLERKVPTLVEKPMTMDYNQAMELVAISEDNRISFAVGQIFRFHPMTNEIIKQLREFDDCDKQGNILAIRAVRSGLHQTRSDCGVLWDFAIHDVDLINYILSQITVCEYGHDNRYYKKYPGKVLNIHSVCGHPLRTENEDIASLVYSTDGIYTSVDVDWISPIKERSLKIITTRGTIEADFVKEELRIHKSGHMPPENDHGEFKFNVRMGDIIIPQITHEEPLKEELKEFIESVRGKLIPRNSANRCLEAIKIIGSINKILNNSFHNVGGANNNAN